VRIFEEHNLGYIRVDSWMKYDSPVEQFRTVFTLIKDTDALILDLRNNGGGILAWSTLFTNYLIDTKNQELEPNFSWLEQKISRFYVYDITSAEEDAINNLFSQASAMKEFLHSIANVDIPEEALMKYYVDGEFQNLSLGILLNHEKNLIPPYLKPIYVLTNGGSFSATDLCLSILKDFNRIKIIGSPNGAGGGSPRFFTLPNSNLQVYLSSASFYPPSGRMIEGNPFNPDVLLTPSAKDVAVGIDRVLSETVNIAINGLSPFSSFSSIETDMTAKPIYSTIEEKKPDWQKLPTVNFIPSLLPAKLKLKKN
jgi:C-terminal processing protease CtpA/Prc